MSRIVLQRSLSLFVLAAAVSAAPGCGKKSPSAAGGGFQMPPTPVETAPVNRGPVSDRFTAVGTVEAGDAITVVSEIDGVIVALPFREGGQVQQGALLAQIDDATLRAEVERNEAVCQQSQTMYDRVKAVVDQKAGAPQDLDDADAALKVARANLALAKAQLAKTRVTAPFDGFVGARRISPGAFVRGGEPITDLASIAELRVTFSAPERLLGKLSRGSAVTVSTTAFPGVELTGRLDVIEPVLDPATRSARVIARVSNPKSLFRPGMSADITVVLSERAEALTVPNEAVFVQGNQPYVFVVNPDSSVVRAAVTLGTRLAADVEVTAGLQGGQTVVRAGHQKLYDGAKVMPVPHGQAAPAEEAQR